MQVRTHQKKRNRGQYLGDLLCPLPVASGHVFLLTYQCIHQAHLKLHQWSMPKVFIGLSVYGHYWLNHWPCDYTQPLAFLLSPEAGLFQTPKFLLTQLIFLVTSSHSESSYLSVQTQVSSKKLMRNKDIFITRGNSKDFEAPSQEPGTKASQILYCTKDGLSIHRFYLLVCD